MKKILKAANVADAEEAVKAIKTFDEAEWDKVVIYCPLQPFQFLSDFIILGQTSILGRSTAFQV